MPGVRDDLRGTYAGLASDEAIAHLTSLGVTAVELLPIHHIADEHALVERGLTNYWGYSTIGFLAPHAGYAATGHPRRAGARVQGHGEGVAPGGDRGDPRRRLQPHGGGRPPGPEPVVSRHRQPRLLPHRARRPEPVRGLHGHRQLAQPTASLGTPADHGLAALLRARVPRRRVPLRPRGGARARAPRRRSPVDVLRDHRPGSRPVPGEADRRAVGRRRRRVPGRELPRPVDRVERALPRHDAGLLARATRRSARSRSASPARATSTSTTGAGRSPRSTTSPATTASRCATSSRTSGSTTRRTARATTTAPTTTAAGTAASRARRTTRPSPSCAAGRSATSWPRCCSPRACRCFSPATSRGGRSAATTTRTARTTSCRGSTGSRATTVAACSTSCAASCGCVASIRSFRRSEFLTGRAVNGSGAPDVWWFRPDGRKMTNADWARGDAFALGAFLNGEEIGARGGDGLPLVDDSFLVLFNAWQDALEFTAAAGSVRPAAGASRSRRPSRRASPARSSVAARGAVTVEGRSLLVLRRPRARAAPDGPASGARAGRPAGRCSRRRQALDDERVELRARALARGGAAPPRPRARSGRGGWWSSRGTRRRRR